MYKKIILLLLATGLLSSSALFAIKGPRSSASKAKVSEVTEESEENSDSIVSTKTDKTEISDKNSKKITILPIRPRRKKPITKIFLPGHDKKSKSMVCQGIAYIPDELMPNGEPRYVLLSYHPNRAVSSAPSQLVVIDRERKEKNKAIRRFSLMKLYSNTTRDYFEYLDAISNNTDYDFYGNNLVNLASNSITVYEKSKTLSDAEAQNDEEFDEAEVDDELIDVDGNDEEEDEEEENFIEDDYNEISSTMETKSIKTGSIDNKLASISWEIKNEEYDDEDDENDNSVVAVTELDDEEDDELDSKDEESMKTLSNIVGGASLPYRGHAGGIAVAGNYVWVSSNFKLWGFSLKRIKQFIKYSYAKPIKEKGLPKSLRKLPAFKLASTKQIGVDAKSSFISYDGNFIWVGEYVRNKKNVEGKNYPPVKHHILFKKHQAWIAGYRYNSEKDELASETTYSVEYNGKVHKVRKPDVVYAVRNNAQGFAVCGRYLALAVSQGTKKSKIQIFKNPLTRFWIIPEPNYYICNTKDTEVASDSIKSISTENIASKADVSNDKNKTTNILIDNVETYKVDGKTYSVEAYDLTKKNRVAVITKPIPAQIQDLEYDGDNLYATFACNSGTFRAKHKKEKTFITKNFFLIDLDRYVGGGSLYPIRPIRPIRPPRPVYPYRPLIKTDDTTGKLIDTINYNQPDVATYDTIQEYNTEMSDENIIEDTNLEDNTGINDEVINDDSNLEDSYPEDEEY